MNCVLSIGPSLHFNPNLFHINTVGVQVQVQIQALGLRNKHESLLIFGTVKQAASRNFPSLNQSVLAAISVLDGDREMSQKTLLGEPKYHRQDLLACWSLQAAFGCLDRNLVWWHRGQITEKGRSQWVSPMASPFSIAAWHTILLISHMKQPKPVRTIRVK